MPEESIAAYFNNILAITTFILVLAFIFSLIFLISRILTGQKKPDKGNFSGIEVGEAARFDKRNVISDYKEDPNRRKNIFILAIVFIIIIYFILLVLCIFNFSRNPSVNLNLFLIVGIIFHLILITIYVIKSKIIG